MTGDGFEGLAETGFYGCETIASAAQQNAAGGKAVIRLGEEAEISSGVMLIS